MVNKIKKKKEYVNNADFLQALIEHKNKCIENEKLNLPEPKVSDYIGECFIKIAENISRKPNFAKYTFKDEMVADGIENSIRYFRNFDPLKSDNPFSYFTQIIYYAFLRRIAREKTQLYVKYKSTEQFGLMMDDEFYEDEDGVLQQFEVYDNISDYIYNFEEKKKIKKPEKPKGIELFFKKID